MPGAEGIVGTIGDAIIKKIQDDLAAVGLPVAGDETAPPRIGPSTRGQIKAFQTRHKLSTPASGDLIPTASILALAAIFATEQDRAKVREKLKNAVSTSLASPEYNYWLARYALLVGDYTTALTAAQTFQGSENIRSLILPVTNPALAPRQPELPHPENFYSYREDLIDPSLLLPLRSDLDALTVAQYAAYLSRGGMTVDPKTVDVAHFAAVVNKARIALAAVDAWQTGNRHAAHRELSLAMQSYRRCQSLAADYFDAVGFEPHGDSGAQRLEGALARLRQAESTNSLFWNALRCRRILISLQELEEQDRQKTIGTDGAFASAAAFVAILTDRDEFGTNAAALNQAQRLDPFLVVLATVWVPLAIGELNCQLRQFDAALQEFTGLLSSQNRAALRFRYLCEFVEIPFIRLLTLEALLKKADAQYQAGVTADAQTFPESAIYHGLAAAQTYLEVISHIAEDGQYTANVAQARTTLVTSIQQTLQRGDTRSMAFREIGKRITVPTVSSLTTALPGMDRNLGPHQPITTIIAPDLRSTNPRVYAVNLLATARLEQIRSGFNYLGYSPDYVPPWRFSFLLDRARYFADHAKNAQRDYLNFLNNAEHEEFQEQSVAQNVEMEQSNLQIETAKTGLANAELAAAQAAADGAALHAKNADAAANEYSDFESQAQEADAFSFAGALFGDVAKIAEGIVTDNPGDVAGGLFGLATTVTGSSLNEMRRQMEFHNLERTAIEAQAAAGEALKKVTVACSSLVIASLQRQAAILRHQFAVANLNYLRGRSLGSDQWFRLANGIRTVSDSYLHDAIEIAFLAQQAYEFESDKRVDIVRFDYDVSDAGAMLAADFLLRDLDTLEQDFVVTQRTRQQQVRYVLSMAREFPETLRTLAGTGNVMFSMRLEQLERRFPGLTNLRISSVELQPLALMDPTRVSVELTHLGTGMIRLKAQPGTSPLNNTDVLTEDDWLDKPGTDWPIKIHVSGPETAVFSGLSRQDAAGLGLIASTERGAFEGLPGASNWQIDMSMKENQVVPDSLADVLITFTLSGYYDAGLKDVVSTAAASARPFANSSFLSARRMLPDAYYSLIHYGKLDWTLSERMLSVAGKPSELRNLAVILPLVSGGPELGRSYCRYRVQIEVVSGGVQVRTVLPQLAMVPSGLTLHCGFSGAAGTEATWDFGDGTPLVQGVAVQHTYARPGRYEVRTLLVKDAKLFEYRSAAVVSVTHPVVAPLIVTPTFSAGAASSDGTVPLAVSTPASVTNISIECSAGGARAWSDSGPATLHLVPGSYVLEFLATRKLSARFYSKQRYTPASAVSLARGRVTTNRTFDPKSGAETTTSRNAFSTQLFGSGTGSITLSPIDRWTVELPLAENPWFRTVSASEVVEFDGRELADAVLNLEFMGAQ